MGNKQSVKINTFMEEFLLKKILHALLVSVTLLLLVGCTNGKDLTSDWHERAETSGFVFTSNDGYQLLFGSEGLIASDSVSDEEAVSSDAFPFELNKTYPDYEVSKEDEVITIKTADDLEFDLKIIGERVYKDEENNRDYLTNTYLFREEE